MVREKIELAPNSLAPASRPLWSAAVERLQEAKAGLRHMQAATDQVSFECGWIRAIDSLEEFWTSFFEEGKQKFSTFQPWAGQLFVAERNKDELLKYLCQARHQSQHGNACLDWEEGQLLIAPGFNGHIKSLAIFQDRTFEMDSASAPGSSDKAALTFAGGSARLPKIVNKKYGNSFDPPEGHMGKSYPAMSPMFAIELALKFYVAAMNAALDKFGKVNQQSTQAG